MRKSSPSTCRPRGRRRAWSRCSRAPIRPGPASNPRRSSRATRAAAARPSRFRTATGSPTDAYASSARRSRSWWRRRRSPHRMRPRKSRSSTAICPRWSMRRPLWRRAPSSSTRRYPATSASTTSTATRREPTRPLRRLRTSRASPWTASAWSATQWSPRPVSPHTTRRPTSTTCTSARRAFRSCGEARAASPAFPRRESWSTPRTWAAGSGSARMPTRNTASACLRQRRSGDP